MRPNEKIIEKYFNNFVDSESDSRTQRKGGQHFVASLYWDSTNLFSYSLKRSSSETLADRLAAIGLIWTQPNLKIKASHRLYVKREIVQNVDLYNTFENLRRRTFSSTTWSL